MKESKESSVSVPATHLSQPVANVLCGGGHRGWGDWSGVITGGLSIVGQQQVEVAVFERGQSLKDILEIVILPPINVLLS